MKKKRKKKRVGVLVFFFTLFFGVGISFYVYGQIDTSNTATNVVTVGKVDVELIMTEHDAGVIAPGDKISNTVAVANVGNYPAYIRMLVKKHWEISEGGVAFSPAQISAKYPKLSVDAIDIQLKEDWTKGVTPSFYPGYECYYYNEAVPSGKNRSVNAVCFSDAYTLKVEETPGDGGISNEMLVSFTKNGAKVYGYYEVIVEAIQADTCIPITNEKDEIVNWNDIPDTSAPMPTVSFDPAATPAGVVNFNSENTEISNADSFITMNNLVPGLTEERVVEIKNTSEQTLPVYVYAESAEDYDSLTDDQKEWLEQLQLVVGLKDGTILYQDSFYKPNSDEPMLSKDNPILIGNFPSDTSENLYVAIHCPASWTKGDVRVKVNWIFATKKAISTSTPKPTATPVLTEAPPSTPEPTEQPTKEPTKQPNPTSVIVTKIPNVEPTPTSEVLDPKPESTAEVTDTPLPTPKPTNGIELLESEKPKVTKPAATKPVATKPSELNPADEQNADRPPEGEEEVPVRTSTPKKPDKVKEERPTKTGDATPIVIWLVLLVVSGAGMVVTFVQLQRRR